MLDGTENARRIGAASERRNWKHGRHSREAIEQRRETHALMRVFQGEMDAMLGNP